MAETTFHVLDVFAEKRYAGNQLAVFRHVEGIDDAEMQQIARETNFSETTFIMSEEPRDGGYRVRIFTPGEEVPFAGHPTLGTAYVIQQEIIREPIDQVVLDLKVGKIPVTFSYCDGKPDLLWMRQRPPVFGRTLTPADIAATIGLSEGDIDLRFPIQEVSTGMGAVVVPLKNLRALQQARVDRRLFLETVADLDAKNIFVFCAESHGDGGDFSARCFAEFYGITEDPATGSANGCFAGYLATYCHPNTGSISVKVEQGYEIGRPSHLYLEAAAENDLISVSVGGRVVPLARGVWQ